MSDVGEFLDGLGDQIDLENRKEVDDKRSRLSAVELPGGREVFLYHTLDLEGEGNEGGGSVWAMMPEVVDVVLEGGVDAALENKELKNKIGLAARFMTIENPDGGFRGLLLDFYNDPGGVKGIFGAEVEISNHAKGLVDLLADDNKKNPFRSVVRELLRPLVIKQADLLSRDSKGIEHMDVAIEFFAGVEKARKTAENVLDGFSHTDFETTRSGQDRTSLRTTMNLE